MSTRIDQVVDAQLLQRAVLDRRWTVLARTGVDLAGVATWDRGLDRRRRLLVPVDVQAFVVPKSGGEKTVPVTGGPGDPAPFADGSVRPAGVHLHWAMPDALLRGRSVPPTTGTGPSSLELPPLPDRWVVVRALMPTGSRQTLLRGWVLDARTGSVTPLATYAGTPNPAPADTPVLDPLDGASGGSLVWTASYTASAGRFGFHDPLDDVPPPTPGAANGLDARSGAVYTVAGWWSDITQDPLAGPAGSKQLDALLAQLGWRAVHDGQDGPEKSEDPRVERLRAGLGLTSSPDQAEVSVTTAEGRPVARSLGQAAVTMAMPVSKAQHVLVGPALPRYATLLHGAVLGVPVDGTVPAGVDDRPSAAGVSLALGLDVDDVVGAFGANVFGATDAARRSAEQLASAFTSDLLDRIGTPDGLMDLAEREHEDGFWSLPGTPIAAARADRLRAEDSAPVNPVTVGRKGRGAFAASKGDQLSRLDTKISWKGKTDLREKSRDSDDKRSRTTQDALGDDRKRGGLSARPEAREVVRPAPRFFRPQPPMLALRGAHPNHRHHGDGLYDADNLLRCRYPSECVARWEGVVDGATIVPSLGSGAVPFEVLNVVREAVLLNPYAHRWLAAAGASGTAGRAGALEARLAGEMVRLYGGDGRYDGTTRIDELRGVARAAAGNWNDVSAPKTRVIREATAILAEHSILPGTPPSPVALTTWRQPWVPLWVEWQVTLEGTTTLDGWTLDTLDLEPTPAAPAPNAIFTFVGRSPTSQGVSKALHLSIERWLTAEQQRDATNASQSQLSDVDEAALDRLSDFLAPLDLVSASLDGIREQLLGMPFVGHVEHVGAGENPLPLADSLPTPFFGGTLRLDALRLVDAFGRTLTVPVNTVATTTTLEVTGAPTSIRLRPRAQHLARWLWRLVDPAHAPTAEPTAAAEAFVDQLQPTLAVNPVAGFLLPDHIDEALEVFDVGGHPLGQLAHDALSGAVFWEPAPGRPVPPDAGPLTGLTAAQMLVGSLAGGVVVADVTARDSATPPQASALTALLRAIDTTLWSVDTFAAVGSPTVAGLVGRPVAVVRATLRVDLPSDVSEVVTTHAGGTAARQAAFDALADLRIPVRLGDLHRTDDAVLGFFVDDDYTRLHLVDRVVAATAREYGRHRGYLGLLGDTTVPPVDPLAHPFVVAEDTLTIRPGQTLRLTILMLPAGKAHLTSGLLPRKALALNNAWVAPGLARMAPSVRVGPLLVDPSEIRLPLVNALGDKQTFTRRTGPLTWRDDPIIAATQAALLPRMPHEAQEGWIRVTPNEDSGAPV